jgi:hypothetical protein
MKRIILVISLLMVTSAVRTQHMEAGVFGGGSYYLGDINPAYHFMQTKPAYGLLLRNSFGTRWVLKVSAYRGEVSADDYVSEYHLTRGLNFTSTITDFAAIMEFNFLDYYTGSRRHRWSPFIFAGVGVFLFDPISDGVNLRDVGTEGQNDDFNKRSPYNLYSFTMPFGFGLKFSLGQKFGLGVEWGMRKTLTDYIDDVSTTYYLQGDQIDPGNTEEMLSDPTLLHSPNDERGNPRTKDWYNFFGITLTYKFELFGNKGCIDIPRKNYKIDK